MKSSHHLFIVAAFGFAACKPLPPPNPPEPKPVEIDPAICKLADEADAVWNEDVRDSLDLSVKIIEGKIEAWEAEQLTAQFDVFTANWIAASETACDEHYFKKNISEEKYKEQRACFKEVLQKARDAIEMMRVGDRQAVEECQLLEDALDMCHE